MHKQINCRSQLLILYVTSVLSVGAKHSGWKAQLVHYMYVFSKSDVQYCLGQSGIIPDAYLRNIIEMLQNSEGVNLHQVDMT